MLSYDVTIFYDVAGKKNVSKQETMPWLYVLLRILLIEPPLSISHIGHSFQCNVFSSTKVYL